MEAVLKAYGEIAKIDLGEVVGAFDNPEVISKAAARNTGEVYDLTRFLCELGFVDPTSPDGSAARV